MSNEFFNFSAPLSDFTRALAGRINDLGTAVEAGFDKLPSPNALAGGLQGYGESTGSGGDYIVSPSPAVTALVTGLRIQFRAGHTSTGPSRLKVSDLAFSPILDRAGVPIVAGAIQLGFFYEARFVGGAWRVQTPLGLVPVAAGVVVQDGVADTTAGRAMLVGGLGFGGVTPFYPTEVTDFDQFVIPGRWNVPLITGGYNAATRPTIQSGIIEIERRTASLIFQTFRSTNTGDSGRVYTRAFTSVAWTPWAESFTQQSIIGAVSQVGGVPTGALVFSGSNANGRFWQFADGLQICRMDLFEATTAISTAHMGAFRSTSSSWTYPAAFIAAPAVQATAIKLSATGAICGDPGTTLVPVHWIAGASQSSALRAASLHAIGRWF